jgi:trehalose 6-phosphate phosphatase
LVGQHGLEHRRADGRTARALAEPGLDQARAILAAFAATHDGVMVEDKQTSLALHFRRAPGFAAACRDMVGGLAGASRGRLKPVAGKMVVELLPQGSGKDRAIAALLAEPPFAGRVPIFIGDDEADEEGFAVIDQLGGISIHVGEGVTSARYRLGSVDAVQTWLARVVAR